MQTANPLHPPLSFDKKKITWGPLPGASMGLTLSSVITQGDQPVVIITPDTLMALRLSHELHFFNPLIDIMHFPDWETLPYDAFSPHHDIISARLAALHNIPLLQKGVIITPITTLIHRVPPREFLEKHVFLLSEGDRLPITPTRQRLEKAGYRCVTQVREHGEFAVRGSIIDVFPMGSDTPYRIDLFDNDVDSIRTFSIDTQRSIEKINKITLLPAKEFPLNDEAIELFREQWRSQFTGNPLNCPIYQDISEGICPPGIEYYLPFFFEKTETLFDYFPENSLLIRIGDTHTKAEEFWQEIRLRYDQYAHDITRPLLAPSQIFIPVADTFQKMQNYRLIQVSAEPLPEKEQDIHFMVQPPPTLSIDHKASRPLAALENFLASYTGRVLFCAETTGRREVLLELFHRIQLYPTFVASWGDFLAGDMRYALTIGPLDDGFLLENPSCAIVAETQLFGKRIMQRRRRKSTAQDFDAIIKDLTELAIGAPVVHLDHGVGRYLGLETLTVGDEVGEFLCLDYADHAKLYVPVTALHLISRYTGSEPEHAPWHKLGTDQWQRAKRKAAQQVRDIAAELLDIYAKREAQKGFACTDIDGQYTAFAAAFPFEETPDQQQAIDQVIADMHAEKPMDRLVCGDVGFGKTEVAMRAAFIAVQNGKQVAVLVPTTLLAQQHYQTFLDRFADWPIQIEVVSRFRSNKEQQKIIERLAHGKIDIVIGTHKLLQEQIIFKSLGLLVIDEEHRFGVQQKERLKALRTSVDILTLTATPIPRTLNMAFAGIRDLSLIATPPARRLSIKTFVHEYQDSLIQEAISREIMRGGQVYFLHNDVATIEKMAQTIEKQIPEARIGIAHGQMRERELEQVMSDFYHRRFNIFA